MIPLASMDNCTAHLKSNLVVQYSAVCNNYGTVLLRNQRLGISILFSLTPDPVLIVTSFYIPLTSYNKGVSPRNICQFQIGIHIQLRTL